LRKVFRRPLTGQPNSRLAKASGKTNAHRLASE
jgi:hypothetical protein